MGLICVEGKFGWILRENQRLAWLAGWLPSFSFLCLFVFKWIKTNSLHENNLRKILIINRMPRENKDFLVKQQKEVAFLLWVWPACTREGCWWVLSDVWMPPPSVTTFSSQHCFKAAKHSARTGEDTNIIWLLCSQGTTDIYWLSRIQSTVRQGLSSKHEMFGEHRRKELLF